MIESGVGDMFYDKLVYVSRYGYYYVRKYDEFYRNYVIWCDNWLNWLIYYGRINGRLRDLMVGYMIWW